MDTLLSAASLLLAILGVMYGLWYPEISSALQVTPSRFSEDDRSREEKVRLTLYHRALPLAIFGIALVAVFLPDTVSIITHSVNRLTSDGWVTFTDYDAIKTSFVLVVTTFIGLTVHFLRFTSRLIVLRKRFKEHRRSTTHSS